MSTHPILPAPVFLGDAFSYQNLNSSLASSSALASLMPSSNFILASGSHPMMALPASVAGLMRLPAAFLQLAGSGTTNKLDDQDQNMGRLAVAEALRLNDKDKGRPYGPILRGFVYNMYKKNPNISPWRARQEYQSARKDLETIWQNAVKPREGSVAAFAKTAVDMADELADFIPDKAPRRAQWVKRGIKVGAPLGKYLIDRMENFADEQVIIPQAKKQRQRLLEDVFAEDGKMDLQRSVELQAMATEGPKILLDDYGFPRTDYTEYRGLDDLLNQEILNPDGLSLGMSYDAVAEASGEDFEETVLNKMAELNRELIQLKVSEEQRVQAYRKAMDEHQKAMNRFVEEESQKIRDAYVGILEKHTDQFITDPDLRTELKRQINLNPEIGVRSLLRRAPSAEVRLALAKSLEEDKVITDGDRINFLFYARLEDDVARERSQNMAAFEEKVGAVRMGAMAAANFLTNHPETRQHIVSVANASADIAVLVNQLNNEAITQSAMSMNVAIIAGTLAMSLINSGPSSEEMMMGFIADLVGGLQKQIENLQKNMNERFDLLDKKLDHMYKDIMDALAKIETALRNEAQLTRFEIRRVLLKAQDLIYKTYQTSRRIDEAFKEISEDDLKKAQSGCLAANVKNLPNKHDFEKCADTFKHYAVTKARDNIATRRSLVPPKLSDELSDGRALPMALVDNFDAALGLHPYNMGEAIAFINWYVSQQYRIQLFPQPRDNESCHDAGDYYGTAKVLPNWDVWERSVRSLVRLTDLFPDEAAQSFSPSGKNNIKLFKLAQCPGEDLALFFRNIVNAGGLDLFKAVLADYYASVLKFKKALKQAGQDFLYHQERPYLVSDLLKADKSKKVFDLFSDGTEAKLGFIFGEQRAKLLVCKSCDFIGNPKMTLGLRPAQLKAMVPVEARRAVALNMAYVKYTVEYLGFDGRLYDITERRLIHSSPSGSPNNQMQPYLKYTRIRLKHPVTGDKIKKVIIERINVPRDNSEKSRQMRSTASSIEHLKRKSRTVKKALEEKFGVHRFRIRAELVFRPLQEGEKEGSHFMLFDQVVHRNKKKSKREDKLLPPQALAGDENSIEKIFGNSKKATHHNKLPEKKRQHNLSQINEIVASRLPQIRSHFTMTVATHLRGQDVPKDYDFRALDEAAKGVLAHRRLFNMLVRMGLSRDLKKQLDLEYDLVGNGGLLGPKEVAHLLLNNGNDINNTLALDEAYPNLQALMSDAEGQARNRDDLEARTYRVTREIEDLFANGVSGQIPLSLQSHLKDLDRLIEKYE